MALLGAHVSVAGGVDRSLARGRELGCEAIQIFVINPNRWQVKMLAEETIDRFRRARCMPVIAHASYLINLCSTNPATLARSRTSLARQLELCNRLGLEALVIHPGAHLGAGVRAGMELVARSLDMVLAECPATTTRLLLENTAGHGTLLGGTFEELAGILERVEHQAERLGVCLDSCHSFAAGYSLQDMTGYQEMLAALEATVGPGRVAACHLNDSKFLRGSHRDRHANIGEGKIGLEFFAAIIHDKRFETTPMILETPLGKDEKGHRRDLAALRRL